MESKDEVARILGKRLAILLATQNITQSEATKIADCSQKYISLCASGKHILNTFAILSFCEKFNLPIDYWDPKNKEFYRHIAE